jgi:hypothetical protein
MQVFRDPLTRRADKAVRAVGAVAINAYGLLHADLVVCLLPASCATHCWCTTTHTGVPELKALPALRDAQVREAPTHCQCASREDYPPLCNRAIDQRARGTAGGGKPTHEWAAYDPTRSTPQSSLERESSTKLSTRPLVQHDCIIYTRKSIENTDAVSLSRDGMLLCALLLGGTMVLESLE